MKTASQIFKEEIEENHISESDREILLKYLREYLANVDKSWNYITLVELHDEHELDEFFIITKSSKIL
jgi:hypothetical protein